MKTALWLLSFIALVVLLAGMGYCWSNRSGHSALDPNLAYGFFGPVFAIGLVARQITRGTWFSAQVTEVIGFIGIIFIIVITRLGILNQYETWIADGMRNRHPYADLILAMFLFGGLGGSLLVAYLATPKAQQDGAGQPATRPVDEPLGGDKPQPEAEGRDR